MKGTFEIIVRVGFPGLVFLLGWFSHNLGDSLGIKLMVAGALIFLIINLVLPLIDNK